jgi:hypothetical protein
VHGRPKRQDRYHDRCRDSSWTRPLEPTRLYRSIYIDIDIYRHNTTVSFYIHRYRYISPWHASYPFLIDCIVIDR